MTGSDDCGGTGVTEGLPQVLGVLYRRTGVGAFDLPTGNELKVGPVVWHGDELRDLFHRSLLRTSRSGSGVRFLISSFLDVVVLARPGRRVSEHDRAAARLICLITSGRSL
jgi:hypothetical protein